MPDTSVKYFDSTMSGAPSLSNVAGDLIAVLDACLVNGFGSVTLDSLVIASNVATGTRTQGTGHGFAMVGNTGPVIQIEDASPSGLNGEWRLASVPSSTTFTFATSGITDQTATGTIKAKRSPAGFSKAFSGTNTVAYRSDNVAGNRLYLRVDDTNTTYARICGYETMSDVDTGTGLFPTDTQISGGEYAYKANAASRDWLLVSDGQMIYLLTDASGSAYWIGGLVFGDIVSFKSPDVYATLLIGAATSSGRMRLYETNSTAASYLARSYTYFGESITSARYTHGRNSITHYLGMAEQDYPQPVDNSLYLWPVDCWESTVAARGLMPGLWNPIHDGNVPHGATFDGIPTLPGRTLLASRIANNLSAATPVVVFDITGPWR